MTLKLRDIPAKKLRDLFEIRDGVLFWRERPRSDFRGGAGWHNFNRQFAGQIAGTRTKEGRLNIKINGQDYKRARIVWALHNGCWPTSQIDHKNGDVSDDRIENLRPATAQQNAQNRSHTTNNSSGFMGVTYHKQTGKWWARITLAGKTQSLGLHHTIPDALTVVKEARRRTFGDFARE